ncbi:MAG: acetyl-CoA carboxylase biotin carboxyl carrier protein subunit [Chloroflexi bacterium]|nr:acetyl-CoA carboxylase biotin carboxyl carrier protein subunit [Chloroflexota bacterium]
MKIHVKIEDKTYEVTVGDLQARPVIASVDGEDFEVWPEEMSIPTESSPSSTSAQPASIPPMQKPVNESNGDTKSVKAPLPGVIIDIMVSQGDPITYGQELCVLEAMKMKNTIRANREGRIKKVHVNVGDQVQHSALLMEFEN